MSPCKKPLLQGRTRSRLTMIPLLIVLITTITITIPITTIPITATAAPTVSTTKTDKTSCADAVVAYLQQAVTQRSAIAAQELKARAELNEMRSIAAEEKDGQRSVRSDTKQRLKEAWTVFESAAAAVRTFDENTIKRHGNLPRLCIREMDAMCTTTPNTDSYLEQVKYVGEITWLHVLLFTETLRGVCRFTLAEYQPVRDVYKEIVNFFSHHSNKVYDEIQLFRKNRGFDEDSNGLVEALQLGLMYAKVATYEFVPKLTIFSTIIIAIAFAPFLISAVLLPHLVWRVWVKLFFLHHTYDMTFDGFLVSLWEFVGLVRNKEWSLLQTRLTTAFIALITDGGSRTFYNGVLALMIVLLLVLLLFTAMYTWMRIPFWLLGPDVDEGSSTVIIKMKKGVAKAAMDTQIHHHNNNNMNTNTKNTNTNTNTKNNNNNTKSNNNNNNNNSGRGSTNIGTVRRSKKMNTPSHDSGSNSSNDKNKRRR